MASKEGNEKTENSSTSKPPVKPKGKRNIMLERFQNYQHKPPVSRYTYKPELFFFYGTLTDPLQLQQVLQLPEPPILKPARVPSRKIMLWGQYPTLVNGTFDDFVDGMAYFVETEEQLKMLQHYETDAYVVVGARIIVDGEKVGGCAFEWLGDKGELREGSWSLKEWKEGVEEEMASHFRPVLE